MGIQWTELMKDAGSGTGGFEPLPIGTYDVEVVDSKATTSQSGKLMFKVQMKVLSGPHANRIIWNQFVVSPENANALSIFFSHMRALGLGQEFFAGQPSEDVVAAAILGKKCRIDVGQREWNGQIRNEVKKVISTDATVTSVAPAAPAVAVPAADIPPTPASVPAAAPASPF